MISFAPPEFRTTVDVLVTWTAAVTMIRYAHTLSKSRESTLEVRTLFLATVLAAALLLRGFSWLLPDISGLAIAVGIPASFLPLAATLFVEGLLRRHVPKKMKIFAITATVTALAGTIASGIAAEPGLTSGFTRLFLVPLMLTLVSLSIVLMTRDRSSLSRTDNSLVTACLVVTLVSLPLAMTDFRLDSGWPFARMGALGPLLICYTLLRTPQENARLRRWVRDIALLTGKSILATLLLRILLPEMGWPVFADFFVLTFALVISYAVWDRLRDSETSNRVTELLSWLASEPPATIGGFHRELRYLSLTADAVIITGDDLTRYDRDAVLRAVSGRSNVVALARLRQLRDSDTGTFDALETRGADQLTDLLERKGITHIGLLSEEPLCLLATTLPELPGSRDSELAFGAVLRRGQHALSLSARSSTRGHDNAA
jgi:hypothetical protein